MAIKAKWKKDNQIYLFLGVGFGAYKAMMAANAWHMISPEVDSKEIGMVAMCDRNGKVGWVDYEEVEIVEIDGQSPGDLLN